MVASVEELRESIRGGASPEYFFFWGHRARQPGEAGKWFLSQWWPCRFSVDGEEYRSAEQFMMAEKARLFGGAAIRSEILATDDPSRAKKLGRRVKGFDEETWNANRFEIVVRGNTEKFSQNSSMRTFLLGTGRTVLVEASPVDRIWGIGLSATDPGARVPETWRGENLLGFALMKVRAQLSSPE